MAKKNTSKTSKTKAKSTQSKKAIAATPKPKTYLIRETITTEKDPFYKKVFWGMTGVLGLIIILMALNSGINGDDFYQNDYSDKLVNYYATMGSDTSALNIPKGKMHLYGGFFDVTTGVVNAMVGNSVMDTNYHDVRHFFNALLGLLAMIFTALLAKQIGGWRAGILALMLIFFSPRFLGHSLMNPKDIPFAAGFAIALYYMVLLFKNMPKPGWKISLGLALGLGLAISSRAGGLLLVAYLGLFAGIDFLLKHGIKGVGSEFKTVLKYAGYVLGISIAGFLLAMLFWPYALVDPINHPLEALEEFSKLGVKIRVLFAGENILSNTTPWHYPITWIWKTIPIFTILGFIGSLFLLPKLYKKYHILPVLLCFFAAIFPVGYVIYKESIIHDGWRHLMFVYPPMVILATLFWMLLENQFKGNKNVTYGIYIVLGLLVAEPAFNIIRNISFPYVYFNPLSGGISSAHGNYETDYWGVSVKQAVEWLEDEGIIHDNLEEPITIGTSYSHNLNVYVVNKYKGKVKTVYIRPNQRYDKEWDYGIFPTRYIRGPHLRAGTWPNSKSVHNIYYNGVPITTIEKAETRDAFEAEKALRERDFPKAIELYTREAQNYPDNELAWVKLAIANANLGNYPASEKAANQALIVAPDNVNSIYYKAISSLNQGRKNDALVLFDKVIRIDNAFSAAYYYMAVIQLDNKDYQSAVGNAIKAIEKNPKLLAAYDLAAKIFDQVGDTAKANQIRTMKAKVQ